MKSTPIKRVGDGEHDYYLAFCQTAHGKNYWRVTGDIDTLPAGDVHHHVLVMAGDDEKAMELCEELFDLEAWHTMERVCCSADNTFFEVTYARTGTGEWYDYSQLDPVEVWSVKVDWPGPAVDFIIVNYHPTGDYGYYYDETNSEGIGAESETVDLFESEASAKMYAITTYLENVLEDEDIEAFHSSETTARLDVLFSVFGEFQIWGSRTGTEPLSIIHSGHAIASDYCYSIAKVPYVDKNTGYSSFEPNGSMYLGTPQCHECRRSNSYGQYGCPRLNKGLKIREARIVGNIPEIKR